jgi:hypothetical protein
MPQEIKAITVGGKFAAVNLHATRGTDCDDIVLPELTNVMQV